MTRGLKVQANVLGARDNPKSWDQALPTAPIICKPIARRVNCRLSQPEDQVTPVQITCHRALALRAAENTLAALEKASR